MKEKELKLIKTEGNAGLTRTSQACDRCRIKKIKCDGKIPSCTNCLAIGYNCQTSDKLTRRAFPRGYTENLEKNLISLQNENAKLLTEMEQLKKQLEQGTASSDSIIDSITPGSTPSLMIPSNELSDVKIKRESIAIPTERLSDNFFRYDNYIENGNYVGLNCVNVSFNRMLSSLGLESIQELTYPAIESPSLYDFIMTKFLHKFPSKTNLDLLISNHFENLNIIPILDENLFFKNYKTMFNSIDNKTENLSSLLRNSQGEDDNLVFITMLILIIQLNCSIFNIHEIHKLIASINLTVNITIPKFQTLLLALHLFHNKNCYKNTVINLTNVAHAGVLSLGLHLNYNNLKQLGPEFNNSKEEKFKYYAVRLKLYWSFYILSTISQIWFGLPQVGFFQKFQVPKLTTILNANQNLKYTLSLIELLTKFEDVNLLSIGDDSQRLKELDTFLVQWRKNCGLNNLFNSLSSESDEHRHKRIKKGKTSLTHDEVIKIQLNMFYLVLRISIHLETANDKQSQLSSQSGYVASSLSREYLAYIIILDRKRELNNLNNFEFHLVPINFLKYCLISMLSIVKLSRDLNKSVNTLFSDSNKLMLQTLKVIKRRYPENFVLFKEIVQFIKLEFQLIDPDLDYDNLNMSLSEPPSSSSFTTPSQTNSLFNESNMSSIQRHMSIVSDTSSNSAVSSIFGGNYTTTLSSTHNNNESDTSSVDELPELGSNLELLFDWNPKDQQELKQLESKTPVLAYDLNYIIDK
jgi:hypothetical protein